MSVFELIYVKNDPALRGIMGDPKVHQSKIDVIHPSVSPTDFVADGPNVLNGIDLRNGYSFVSKTEDMKIQGFLALAGDSHRVLVHRVQCSARFPSRWVGFPLNDGTL